jgi:transposase
MRGPRLSYPIVSAVKEEQESRHLVSSRKAAQGEVLRARILLAVHEHPGWSNVQIATEVGCSVRTVWKWRQRWTEKKSLADLPRPGAPRRFSP